jgi:GNAT superfamily N-acetyltransferase
MPEYRIRCAEREEHASISALALRSKAHWGYTAAFLAACRDELTFDEATCGSGLMHVATEDGIIRGFNLVGGAPPEGELRALFVEPDAIGTGCGKMLLADALEAAREAGCTRVTLDADPGAEGFYRRFGARRIGSTPSGSIAGRMLPHLVFDLAAGAS